MTRETIEEMITIGIEFLTVAIFLVFVVNFVGIQKDFANVKNDIRFTRFIEKAKNVK